MEQLEVHFYEEHYDKLQSFLLHPSKPQEIRTIEEISEEVTFSVNKIPNVTYIPSLTKAINSTRVQSWKNFHHSIIIIQFSTFLQMKLKKKFTCAIKIKRFKIIALSFKSSTSTTQRATHKLTWMSFLFFSFTWLNLWIIAVIAFPPLWEDDFCFKHSLGWILQ